MFPRSCRSYPGYFTAAKHRADPCATVVEDGSSITDVHRVLQGLFICADMALPRHRSFLRKRNDQLSR